MTYEVFNFFDTRCGKFHGLIWDFPGYGYRQVADIHWYQGVYFYALRIFYQPSQREFALIRSRSRMTSECETDGFIATDSGHAVELFSKAMEKFKKVRGGRVDLIIIEGVGSP